jgi:hypothetical protein
VWFPGRLLVALAAAGLPLAPAATLPGPRTTTFDASSYAVIVHVDAGRGSDATGDGSAARPWVSLTRALEQTPPPGGRLAVLVSQGRYRQPTIALKPRVDLFGGFASPGGPRDLLRFATVLDGDDAHRIAIAADDVQLDGLQFTHGRVRGKGAALLIDGVSPKVTNCVFAANRTLLPSAWDPPQLHLTAHDGGAVMCLNAAAPLFEHCLFFDNATECGRGGALACDRGAQPRIRACVFANNRAGLDDPMRSSDGGAVSFFDRSGGEFTGNLVVANRALSRNDAGGLFVALWSAPRIAGNTIVGNYGDDDAGGLFLGGQEHRYGVPLDEIPPADRFTIVVEKNLFAGNANSARNSGAMRVTMESRARFTDNVVAENAGGFYLQRSEIVAERNTIWQDWRFLEDKSSLGPSRFAGNILRGPLDQPIGARVTLTHNMAEPAAGPGSVPVADVFLEDSVAGGIAGLRFDTATCTTVVTTVDELPGRANLAGRPVRLGQSKTGQWRVIRSAGTREFTLWGRLEAETKPPVEFSVLRTFTPKPGAPAGLGARFP